MPAKKFQLNTPIDDADLTERERLFRDLRADGLDIRTAYAGSGYSLVNGWRHTAGQLDRRLKPEVVRLRVGGRIVRMRGSQATEDQRNEILSKLFEIANADIGDLMDEDGGLDLKLARHAGQTKLIRKLEITESKDKEGFVTETKCKIELYSAMEALKSLATILGIEQMPRQNEQDRNEMRDLVEQQITAVMAEKDCDREFAIAWMRELPLPSQAQRYLM